MELKRFGKYEIVAKIGEGGMGEVFRAHDPVLGRDVAIKTMSARAAVDELRQRFHREAQSAARLNHPNIITIHDFGEEQGRMYIAMELLEGSDLKDLLAGPPLELSTKLGLMEQICDGLAFAHAKDIVHRDLKPGNIHVQRNGQVKIMDFGLARVSSSDMTRAGLILGTPHYMSPEQVSGRKATTRSDVFALGSVFYELLSGRKAFDADTLAAVLFQVMQTEPEALETLRPEVPTSLAALIRKAMAKDPAERFAHAGEMHEALRRVRSAILPGSGPIPLISASAQTLPGAATPTGVATPRTTLRGHPTPIASASREATLRQPEPVREATRTMGPPAEATLAANIPTRVVAPAPAAPAPPRPMPRRSVALPAAVPARGTKGLGVAAAAVVAVGVVAAILWAVLPRPVPPTPVPTPAASVASPAAPSPSPGPRLPSLEAVERDLSERDYRAVLEQADAILAVDAGNTGARGLRERAQGALRESQSLRNAVHRELDRADAAAASQALTRLVKLDPRHPELLALTTRLNDLLAAQAEQARRAADARRAASSPAPVASAAPTTLAVVTLPPATLPPPTVPPASTLPPATMPPAPKPVQSEAAARQAIRGVLDEYRAAFETRNADALRAVQPGVDYEAMKQVFATVTGYTVRLEVKDVFVKGDSAQARCVVTYSPVPKPAVKIQPVPTVFHLRRSGDLWVIERLERR